MNVYAVVYGNLDDGVEEDSDQFYLDRDNMLKLAKILKIPLGPLKRHPIIFFDL